ncbi:pilus assembly protein [Brevundimonas sp. 2R-24]|uniref:Pilus assembly protein n=1 Tax=Peiella sedimenti TaxID=3061083 RepID=A0ABT8SLX5_9CAUL|nr:pilus assembly protein [Caulobacteraceae bacterium XZ-24]
MVSRLRRIATFRGDRRGVSAVEFALIAPAVCAFYLGLSEMCQGYMAVRRMGHSAAAVTDLLSQDQVVTRDNIDDAMTIGALLMRPFSTTGLRQRVSSVTIDNQRRAKVDWSRGSGLSARAAGSTVTLPDDMITTNNNSPKVLNIGDSILMTEVEYDYDSPVDYVMPALTRFTQTYYLRPRRSDSITCSNC